MTNIYDDRAAGILYAWEQNCGKDFTVGDREVLRLMIGEAIQKAAWQAQQPGQAIIAHPKA